MLQPSNLWWGLGDVTLGDSEHFLQRSPMRLSPQLPKVVTSSIFQYSTLHRLSILPSTNLSALTPVSRGHLPSKSLSQTLLSEDPELKEDGGKEVGGSSGHREKEDKIRPCRSYNTQY